MLDIEYRVNGFRNGVTGAYFHTVIVNGPEGEADEDAKFLVVAFEETSDGELINEGCTAVFRISDLNTLDLNVDGVHALSAWRPEWAHEKAKLLIKEYHDRRDERIMGAYTYKCPRCEAEMDEVGLSKKLICSNEECAS